ncbi:MAG: VOC family protein [Phycisphaerales bacterium]|nr:MAG: VOC family protein [Phycisphaerales bacterium]
MKRHVTTFVTASMFCLVLSFPADLVLAGDPTGGPAIRGWSHLYIRAIDAERTFRFYHEILGMKFVGSKTDDRGDPTNPKVYYYFQAGQTRLCIGAYPSNPSDYKPMRMNNLQLHWEVSDVSAMYERVRDCGYNDFTQLRTSKWGARTFTVYDPNGFAIALTEWTGKSDWQQPKLLDPTVPFPPRTARQSEEKQHGTNEGSPSDRTVRTARTQQDESTLGKGEEESLVARAGRDPGGPGPAPARGQHGLLQRRLRPPDHSAGHQTTSEP